MKNIIYLLLLFFTFSLSTNAQVHEVERENEEEFEESKDPFLKKNYLKPFMNLQTEEVDYNSLGEIHSFIDKKIADRKKSRTDAAIPYIEWEERGPNNFAGRIQKIMYDPNDPTFRKVWAGSSSTGLFYNNNIEDPNSSWVATNMHASPMGILDISHDPTNTQIFYVSAVGGNIYKSINAGQTWINLTGTTPIRSQDLLVVSSTEIYVASSDGVKKSTDGGNSWITILKPSAGIGGASLIGTILTNSNAVSSIERGSDGTLYTAFACGQIFKSSNNGASWTNILAPDNPSWGGNTLIALAPSTSGANQVIYVLCGRPALDPTSTYPQSAWLRKSIDGGNTWTQKTWTGGSTQLYDNFVIKVHPTDQNMVFGGVTGLQRSINGGDTWISLMPVSNPVTGGADWHDIHFKPTDPTKAIMSNDQGVSFWINTNTNISGVTHHKDFIAVQAHWGAMRQIANDNVFAAATQDQTSKILNGSGGGIIAGTNLSNNEGGWIKFDDDDPNLLMYTAFPGGNRFNIRNLSNNLDFVVTTNFGRYSVSSRIYDSQNNIALATHSLNLNGSIVLSKISNVSTTQNASTNVVSTITIGGVFAKNGSTVLNTELWYTPIIQFGKTPNTLFMGGYSSTGGAVLYKISNLYGSTPTAMLLNPLTTGSSSWVDMISCIAIGANDNQILITLTNNYNYIETLFYTNDGGATWRTLKKLIGAGPNTSTGLPGKFGANYAVFNPNNYNQVILATGAGIWTCDDISLLTPQWEITNAKFGKIPCSNIEVRPSDGTVMVATYGRGIFTAKLNTCQSNIVRTDVINGGVLNIPSSTYIRGTAGNTIQSNGNVKYDAKTYILLDPNFEVKKGGVFKAQIGGCN